MCFQCNIYGITQNMQMGQAHKIKNKGLPQTTVTPLNYVEVEHGDKMVISILLPRILNLYSPIEQTVAFVFKIYYTTIKTRCFMKKEETCTLTLRLPISKKLRLEIIANKESRTINSLCNKIIIDYLEKHDVKK